MSQHRNKRHRSRFRSSANKRESQQNRSNDYDRRTDSYERHYHPIQSNRQYNSHDVPISLDEIINRVEEYPPLIQSLVHELLMEQKKRKLVEERLLICEHDYAVLLGQHEQTINSLTLLKRDFDKCRIDLKNNFMELNELRHSNCQLRAHIDHQLQTERQQTYTEDEIFYAKRQRRY